MPTFTRHGEPMERGAFLSVDGETIHFADCLDLWSDAELAVEGVVRTPDPPPMPRRLLPKSAVQARIDARGRWTDVASLLFTGGLPNIYYARWFAPDWPNVYFDDPDLLLVLHAAGCTAEDIAAITAPMVA